MSNQVWTYPRVNATVRAKKRIPPVYIEDPRVPVLLATVVTNQGPYELTKVRDLTEFIRIFGDLEYDKLGQDALNLYQWLGSVPYNGYAWIKRIEPAFVTESGNDLKYVENLDLLAVATGEINFDTSGNRIILTALKPGEIYAKYEVTISQRKLATGEVSDNYLIDIRDGKNRPVWSSGPIKKNELKLVNETNGVFKFKLEGEIPTNMGNSITATLSMDENDGKKNSGLHSGLDIEKVQKAIKAYYDNLGRIELEDKLSYPISMILDGNYELDVKKSIVNFINDARSDIHFMLTRAKYKTATETIGEEPVKYLDVKSLDELGASEVETLLSFNFPEDGNVAIWAADIAKVIDPLVGKDPVLVSSIYELAAKIPDNDRTYGIWWNFVGARRGRTKGELIRTNTSRDKQNYMDQKTNYIEKTNRDQAFMLQVTTGKAETAHTQLHASRLTKYLEREITWIARRYLHEWNDIDSTTYSDAKQEIQAFLNTFANIAIDMKNPYILDVYKVDADKFRISLTNLKYKDVVHSIDLYIELE